MALRKDKTKELLAEYDKSKTMLDEISLNATQLIAGFVRESGVVLHSVSSRVKDRSSFENKLRRPGKNYQEISAVTDLVGVRLTTYFSEDVDRVAEIVRREFAMDMGNSVDKRIQEDPSRFGYQSLHYVVEYSENRCKLSEYRRFAGVKFEIQIRSILQHAWAEIEHDLGYKSSGAVPADVRRRFARIAGLLELADMEFDGIRKQLDSYKESLPKLLGESASARLDQAVLELLVATDSAIIGLDDAVCSAVGAEISSIDVDNIASTLKKLDFFSIKDVSSLRSVASNNTDEVKRFAKYWLENSYEKFNAGIGLFYLCYVLISKEGYDRALEYLNEFKIDIEKNRESLARDIVDFSLQEN